VANQKSGESWDEARQTALIAQILSGESSLQAACERHELSAEVVQGWVSVFRHKTLAALDDKLWETFRVQGGLAESVSRAAYTGTLEDIPLADLLQTFQMGGKDGVITVTRGNERSFIWCQRGEIVDAESGRLRGEAAVYRILDFDHGQVFADFRLEPRPRTIELPAHVLLMEAARHQDECVRLLGQLDGSHSIYRPAAGAMAVRATPTEREVLDLCDGERAVRDVLDASELADLETLSAMVNLVERGYLLRDGSSELPPRSAPAPVLGRDTPPSIVYSPVISSQLEGDVSRRHAPLLLVGLGLVLGVALWVGVTAFAKPAAWLGALLPALRPSFVLDAHTDPPDAQLSLDGVRIGAGHVRRELPRDGQVHRLSVSAEGYIPTTMLFVDAAPLSRLVLEKLPLTQPVLPPTAAHAAPAGGAP
jgi:hypothetical protein